MNIDNIKVQKYWSKVDCSASEKNFYCFPPIRSHSCKLIFDEYDASRRDWCEYWTVEKYLKHKIPFEKTLSICCGFGEIERILSRLNVSKKIVGVDIAPGAIAEAKNRAKKENINNVEYYVSDIDKEKFPENEFGLIWANGALHHLKDLDTIIPMLYNSLKSAGYLISNEYVGPNYQQIGEREQEIVNAVKHLLPMTLREDYSTQHKGYIGYIESFMNRLLDKIIGKKKTYSQIWRPVSIKHVLRTDPSECVNSSNIIPILKETFDEVEVKYFGGSIMFYAFDGKFYDNFDLENICHRKLLDLIFRIEDTFIEIGEITSDNAHIICKKY